jgi:hypothetical protein
VVALAAWARAAESEKITLAFDWPELLISEVTLDRKIETKGEGQAGIVRTRVSFRVMSEGHPEGQLVRFSRPQFEDLEATGGSAVELAARVQDLALVLPDFVASSDGQILRLEGLDDLRKELLDVATERLTGRGLDDAKRKALVNGFATGPRLHQAVLELWVPLVLVWANQEFLVGQVYRREAPLLLPLAGGMPAPGVILTAVRRHLPCNKDERSVKCVELEVKSALDPGDSARLLEEVRSRSAALAGGKAPPLEAVGFETRQLLVAEPRFLIPHRLELVRRGTQKLAGRTTESLDERQYVFVNHHTRRNPPDDS